MSKHTPRKRFGQNFLRDSSIVSRIISSINPQAEDNIIEIGPGQGALTIPLLKQTGKLTVIELDRDLIKNLHEQCDPHGQLTIHNNDVLEFNFGEAGTSELRIVGNLPYNISTPLLFHLFSYSGLITDMVFMLQKEVVDRICAKVGSSNYSRLSVMSQFYCQVEPLFDVPPEAFFPAPKVTSSVMQLHPREQSENAHIDTELFSNVVKLAFSQRRKMLRKNLSELLSEENFEELGLSSKSRAQDLSVEDYKRLTRYLKSR